jgi:inosine/xanthosine triphosphate pyrophosphatase family protein
VRLILLLVSTLLYSSTFASVQNCESALHRSPWFSAYQTILFNTGHADKWDDFSFLLKDMRPERLDGEISEIDADHVDVVVHKASQFRDSSDSIVLVEDSALHVEGADIGVNVKWRLGLLKNLIGRRAVWDVLIAYRRNDLVYVFKGSVAGRIVAPQSNYHRFAGYFEANVDAEHSDPNFAYFTARSQASRAVLAHDAYAVRPVIERWQGSFQPTTPLAD